MVKQAQVEKELVMEATRSNPDPKTAKKRGGDYQVPDHGFDLADELRMRQMEEDYDIWCCLGAGPDLDGPLIDTHWFTGD